MHNIIKQTYFELKYEALIKQGVSADESALAVIDAYLSSKSKKQQAVNKDQLFWSSAFQWCLSDESFKL